MHEDMFLFFSGDKLYGDDFTPSQIEEWYKDEQEGFADLGPRDRQNYRYSYHQLNMRHGYSNLGQRRFKHALGIGSAYGDEFLPIVSQIEFITILDPSDAFSVTKKINGVPCEYHKPSIDGSMSFKSDSFDLITSLGSLHHIANVSKVMKECFRCLSSKGVMLIREPIVSMGDWTKPRPGLTKRERGIPLKIFEEIIMDIGFTIEQKALCTFSVIPKITNKFNLKIYNNATLVWLDDVFSKVFSWNTLYHRKNFITKIGPTSVYFILEKS